MTRPTKLVKREKGWQADLEIAADALARIARGLERLVDLVEAVKREDELERQERDNHDQS